MAADYAEDVIRTDPAPLPPYPNLRKGCIPSSDKTHNPNTGNAWQGW
jgi:hypothetical protein